MRAPSTMPAASAAAQRLQRAHDHEARFHRGSDEDVGAAGHLGRDAFAARGLGRQRAVRRQRAVDHARRETFPAPAIAFSADRVGGRAKRRREDASIAASSATFGAATPERDRELRPCFDDDVALRGQVGRDVHVRVGQEQHRAADREYPGNRRA